MSRSRRYIFNTLTVLSLLLLLASAGLWVSGMSRESALFYEWPDGWFLIAANDEFVGFFYESLGDFDTGPGMRILTWDRYPPTRSDGISWISYYLDGIYPLGDRVYSIGAPHWYLAFLFSIAPAIWFIKWRKRRKLGSNACTSCGYDLTGNETGQCPECGAGVAKV